MSLFFRAAYRFGFKPWDSGVPPPELVAVVEGPGHLQPTNALDLGCGTGTNTVYMAKHGWNATGVDFVPRAIAMARRKAAAAGVSPRLVVGDVTRLPETLHDGGFGLLLDLGCFHSIPDERRDAYVRGVSKAATSGATMLLFGFVRGARPSRLGPRGLAAGEIAARFAGDWDLVSDVKGQPFMSADVYWYTLRRDDRRNSGLDSRG